MYEFLGCQFHGHCKYDNPKKKLETYIRKGALENLGYKVEMIYGCEWENMEIEDQSENVPPICTMEDMKDTIMTGELFGFVNATFMSLSI